MSESDLPVVERGARCKHLLTKGLFINAGLPAGQHVTGDGNAWCGKTQTIFGPDRQVCDIDECMHPGRDCYIAP